VPTLFETPDEAIRIVLAWQLIVTRRSRWRHCSSGAGRCDSAASECRQPRRGWVYGWRVAQSEARSPGEALRTLFRAEAMKVLVILAGLWLVLQQYKDVVHVAFFATFVINVGVFAAAIPVRDTNQDPRPAGTSKRI